MQHGLSTRVRTIFKGGEDKLIKTLIYEIQKSSFRCNITSNEEFFEDCSKGVVCYKVHKIFFFKILIKFERQH